MTGNEVREQLTKLGIDVEVFDPVMVNYFYDAMQDCSYGMEETLDAFQWFREGWISSAHVAKYG